jgi:hypothetical protein
VTPVPLKIASTFAPGASLSKTNNSESNEGG